MKKYRYFRSAKAVNINIIVFRDVTPCILEVVNILEKAVTCISDPEY
jgi:hypothetical protein